VKYLANAFDKVISEVRVGGPRIKELGGAPVRLDVVGVSKDGKATIFEVKYNYTAVIVRQALGQLLAYSELLKDEKIFEEFADEVMHRTSIEVKPEGIDFAALIGETKDYLSTGIDVNMINKVKLPEPTCILAIAQDELRVFSEP